jgi:hypothetical protein
VNTTFGKGGDNNGAIAGIGGFQLTLLGGKLTALALTHIGPENPSRVVPDADRYMRYLNDIVVTYKPNDTWVFVSDFNYIKDDFAKADAYGFARTSLMPGRPPLRSTRAPSCSQTAEFLRRLLPRQQGFHQRRTRPARDDRERTLRNHLWGRHPGLYLQAGRADQGSDDPPRNPLRSLNDGTRPLNSGKDRDSITVASDIVLTF